MKLRFIALFIITCSLTSCFDIYETFNINEDGSGVYEQKIDMTRAMQFISNMMDQQGMGGMGKKMLEKKDSTIYYKTMVDTISTLTAEQKKVLGKTYAKMHSDEEKAELTMNIFFPYANAGEFATIQSVLSQNETSGSFFDVLMDAASSKEMKKNKGMMGGGDEDGEKKKGGGLPTSRYVYTLNGNTLSRKVKPSTDEQSESMEGIPENMKAMMEEMMIMNMTTIVKTPKPIKDVKGNNSTLSADKKEAKFSKQIKLDTKMSSVDFDFDINY